jgi:hypothetical protein
MKEATHSLRVFDVPESRIEERLGEVVQRVGTLEEAGGDARVIAIARDLLVLLQERSKQLADYRLLLRGKFAELAGVRGRVDADREALAPESARLAAWQAELEAREAAIGLDPDTRAALIAAASAPTIVGGEELAARENSLRSQAEDLLRREAALRERRKGLDDREKRLDALETRLSGGAEPRAASEETSLPLRPPPRPISREEKLEELAQRKRETLLRAGLPVSPRSNGRASGPGEGAAAPEGDGPSAAAPARPAAERFGELFRHLKVPGPEGRRPHRPT